MEMPSARRRQRRAGLLVVQFCLTLLIFFWGYTGEGNAAAGSLPQENSDQGEAAQNRSCDFRVEVSEPDFCVIQGRVYDIDLSLVPITGSCDGSAALSVEGFPSGLTQKLVFPHQTGGLQNGKKVATVRVDTAGVALKKRKAYPLTILASQEGITRTASVNMMLDLPAFDFSIKPDLSELLLYQEEIAETTVEVDLLGSACVAPSPVRLSLHHSSSPLSFAVVPHFSSDSVIPPGKTTVSFKTSSGPEIGSFVTTVAGCCTQEEKERTSEMILKILPRTLSPRAADEQSLETASSVVQKESPPPFDGLVKEGEDVKIDTMENILKNLQFSPKTQEETRKGVEAEANRGHIKASEEEVLALQQSKARVLPIYSVLRTLTFTPSSLEGTPFEKLNMEGAYSTGKYLDGKWTSMVRIFTMPDGGGLVELIEDDIASSGGGKNVISEEGVDFYLHGFPTTVVVKQSQSGMALSRVSWKTAAKAYNLRMEGNVKINGKKKFFLNLAESIPN